MNRDLISREAAAQMLMEKSRSYVVSLFPTSDECRTARETARACAKAVREMEGVDAEPVRHARWAHLGGDEWCCTACSEVIHTEGSWENPTKKYCNECGAKMDGGKEE